jgi:iron(III) transport system permease protein
MTNGSRNLPSYFATAVVGILLFIFIALPVGLVLFESIRLAGPVPINELAAITKAALDKLEPADRERQLARWAATLRPEERIAASATTLELIGKNIPWDSRAPFDEQAKASELAVAGLPVAERKTYDEIYPLAVATAHKRIPLAFRLRDKLTPTEFDILREGTKEGFGFDNYVSVFTSARLHRAFTNSLLLSGTVALLTTAIAFAVSYDINHGAILAPQFVRYLTLIPLVAPPVVISTSMILLFGRNGAISRGLLQDTFALIDADKINLYGWGGVIFAQILGHIPASFIVLDSVLSKQDGRLEEAAASQGASRWQVFTHINLPMAQPGIVRSLILVFMLIMTDFANPLVIGKDIPVLAGVLYDEMIGFQNTRLAAALAVWMILPALLVYYVIERVGRRKRYSSIVSFPSEMPVHVYTKAALTTLAWALICTTILLYGAIVMASFVKIWRVDNTFTLAWYLTGGFGGFTSEYQGVSVVLDSLKVSIVAAPLGGLLAMMLAYLVERARPPGGSVLGFIALLPAILPGVIFGVGYVVTFNLPLGMQSLSLTGTAWILVLNILFANIFIGYLAGRAVLQRYDSAIDEAAESLGASLRQRFSWVTLPIMRHALILGSLYVFVHGLTTLSAAEHLLKGWPGGSGKVLLTPGGSDAIELAMKIARVATGRYKMISFYDSYHGSGFGALSVGGRHADRSPRLGPLMEGTLHVPPFYLLDDTNDDPTDSLRAAQASLEAMRFAFTREREIAAVIAEPIRSTPHIPPDWY